MSPRKLSPLVEKLSNGRHRVEVSLRPSRTPQDLLSCIKKGYSHVRFIDTKGGTELYMLVLPEETKLEGCDFESGSGTLELVGKLNLDYQDVKCKAIIDIATMSGQGWLEPIFAQPSEAPSVPA